MAQATKIIKAAKTTPKLKSQQSQKTNEIKRQTEVNYKKFRWCLVAANIFMLIGMLLASILGVYILYPGVSASAVGFAWAGSWLKGVICSIVGICFLVSCYHLRNMITKAKVKTIDATWATPILTMLVVICVANMIPFVMLFAAPIVVIFYVAVVVASLITKNSC